LPFVVVVVVVVVIVHHGQRRHLLAAHKIIHGEMEKVINENIPTNKDTIATADPDHQLNIADSDNTSN
jgi:sensor domain CHASE-containing protein